MIQFFNFKYLFNAILISFSLQGFGQVTIKPKYTQSSADYLTINKVEITKNQTILYILFENENANKNSLLKRFGIESNENTISIRPSTYLKNTIGNEKFKLIKAVGIPMDPEKLVVNDLEFLNFKLIFEKVTAGIEQIDLIEGKRKDQNETTWNVRGIKIKNPGTQKEEFYELEGQVLDQITQLPITTKIEILAKNTKNNKTDSISTENGSFKKLLAKNKYILTVKAEGYATQDLEIDIKTNVTQNILLQKITENKAIAFKNVTFNSGEHELLTESFAELDTLVQILTKNTTKKILLEGHTDIIGDAKANQLLSEKRVETVKQYLKSKGIDPIRISTKGWGSQKPLQKNGPIASNQQNRRVEFTIIE